MNERPSQIYLHPLGSTIFGAQAMRTRELPTECDAMADLQRGDGTGGILIRHRVTLLYMLWTNDGRTETVPQFKMAKALELLRKGDTRPLLNPLPGDEGKRVVFRGRETGVITSWNSEYVFVRYGDELHAKGTRRADLAWEE